jgi:hypothetical protein
LEDSKNIGIGKTQEYDKNACAKQSICQPGCLVHRNAKKHGQIKVEPHEKVKLESYYASNAFSLVLHA